MQPVTLKVLIYGKCVAVLKEEVWFSIGLDVLPCESGLVGIPSYSMTYPRSVTDYGRHGGQKENRNH